jgi:hypothetical protein
MMNHDTSVACTKKRNPLAMMSRDSLGLRKTRVGRPPQRSLRGKHAARSVEIAISSIVPSSIESREFDLFVTEVTREIRAFIIIFCM